MHIVGPPLRFLGPRMTLGSKHCGGTEMLHSLQAVLLFFVLAGEVQTQKSFQRQIFDKLLEEFLRLLTMFGGMLALFSLPVVC